MKKGNLLLILLVSLVTILTFLWSFYINGFSWLHWMMTSAWNNNSRNLVKTVSKLLVTTKTNTSVPKPFNFKTDEFFSMDLVKHPEEANKLAVLLTTREEMIKEAQRIHMNVFKTVLGKYKYAILFNYPVSENKGDSAISLGQLILLRKLNIELIFSCARTCTEEQINKAQNISRNYTNENLVILFNGGGNVIGWPFADYRRAILIPRFMKFHIVMFPQSIYYIEPQSHIEFCKALYSSHNHLTFVWRDKNSYHLGKRLFPKVQSLLSPDIAYQIGNVPRYMPPTHDILWIKRTDKETPSYQIPSQPSELRMNVSDWVYWKTPTGTSPMENVFLRTTNGLTFLQRGRVVITDRLHGHILCTILGIPHVYIDNAQRKISNYHITWTASVENIVFANSSTDALIQAQKLLKVLDKDLPAVIGEHITVT